METPIIKTDTPTQVATETKSVSTLPEPAKGTQEGRRKAAMDAFDPYQAKITKIEEKEKEKPKDPPPETKDKEGEKDKKKEDPEAKKPEEKDKTEEKKVESPEKAPEQDKKEDKPEEKHKKTAKERVQESRREVIKYKEELERVKRELEELRAIKDEDKSAKQLAKEAVLEEKMSSAIDYETVKLNEYIQELPAGRDRERFEVYYNEIIPTLAEKDPWTVERIEQIDNKYEVLNAIFNSISKGEITLEGWINSPKALKLDALYRVQDFLEKKKNKAGGDDTEKKETKKVEDSVVPNISNPEDITLKTKEQSRRQAVLNAFNPNQEYTILR